MMYRTVFYICTKKYASVRIFEKAYYRHFS